MAVAAPDETSVGTLSSGSELHRWPAVDGSGGGDYDYSSEPQATYPETGADTEAASEATEGLHDKPGCASRTDLSDDAGASFALAGAARASAPSRRLATSDPAPAFSRASAAAAYSDHAAAPKSASLHLLLPGTALWPAARAGDAARPVVGSALEASLRQRWPGRDRAVAMFSRLFCARGPDAAASEGSPPATIVVGREGSGASAFVVDALHSAGALFAVVDCGAVETAREFAETTLALSARAVVGWVLGRLDAGLPLRVPRSAPALASLLMRALLAPDRATTGGQATAVALAKWGDDASGTLKAALLDALRGAASGGGGGGGVAPSTLRKRRRGSLEGGGCGGALFSAAQLASLVGLPRVTSAHAFLQDLSRVAGVGPADVSAAFGLLGGASPQSLEDATTGAFPLHIVFKSAELLGSRVGSRLAVHLMRPPPSGVRRVGTPTTPSCAAHPPSSSRALARPLLQQAHAASSFTAIFITPAPVELLEAATVAGIAASPVSIPFCAPPLDHVLRELRERRRPPGTDVAMWGNVVLHVRLAVGALTGYDLGEMDYAARALYPAYSAPAVAGSGACETGLAAPWLAGWLGVLSISHLASPRAAVLKSDDNRLRALAEPAFAAARAGVLDHDLSCAPAAVLPRAAAAATGPGASEPRPQLRAGAPRGVDLELAYYPKLLLLAAFCASHNPPDTDKRYFSRAGSGRAKKPRKHSHRAAGGSATTVGPALARVFTLERWTALFQALLAGNEDDEGEDAAANGARHQVRLRRLASRDLQGQMTQLQHLRLVERVSPPSELDVVRFRCQASLGAVSAVAAKAAIDLGKYLHSPE